MCSSSPLHQICHSHTCRRLIEKNGFLGSSSGWVGVCLLLPMNSLEFWIHSFLTNILYSQSVSWWCSYGSLILLQIIHEKYILFSTLIVHKVVEFKWGCLPTTVSEMGDWKIVYIYIYIYMCILPYSFPS